MYYNKEKHDIGILRQDGATKVGLLLVRDPKTGAPLYETYDDEYILNQQTTAPGYDALPPEKQFTIILDDFRSGFGLQTYDENDPKRYYESYNMDLRHKGRVIQSYIPTAASLPTLFSFTDGGFEIWASSSTLTNWTRDQATLAQEAGTIHGGTYSVKVTSASTAGQGIYQTANTANWSNDFRGKTVVVTCWAKASAVDNAKIGIEDDAGTTYSSYHTGGGAWEQLQVKRTLSGSATYMKFWCLGCATASVSYFDDFVIPTLGTHGSHWAEFNDDLYLASSSCLLKVANSTGTITFEGGLPNAISSLKVFSDEKLYIGQGVGDDYWEMTTAGAFTENTLSNNNMQFLERVYLTADTMYGNDAVNTIRSTVNPADGGTAWSGTTTVDSSYNNITKLLAHNNALYIMKEDRPYYLDSSGNVKILTNDTVHLADSNGGKHAFIWKGGLYMNWKTALLEYLDGDFTWLNPSDYCTNISAYTGDIQGITGDERYLFVAVDNSTKIEILAGRRETIDSVTSWVWHPIVDLTLTGCNKLHVSNIYQKRLWIASTDSSNSLYYVPLPTSYGDMASDANRSFSTAGSAGTNYFVTPELHANFKGDTKAFTKVVAELGHSYDADIYFECHYWTQASTTWVDAGDFKGTASSREASLYLSSVSSKWIKLKLVGCTDSATTTPILKRLEVRGILYPSRRNLIYCVVRCADDLVLNDGAKDRIQAADIKAALDEAKDTATWPVTFYDINGDTKYVKVLSTKPFSKVIKKDDKTGKVERYYYLLLQEVTLS